MTNLLVCVVAGWEKGEDVVLRFARVLVGGERRRLPIRVFFLLFLLSLSLVSVLRLYVGVIQAIGEGNEGIPRQSTAECSEEVRERE